MKKIAILGGGSWGTALAIVLSRSRTPHRLTLWVHDTAVCERIRATRINEIYLPGFQLPSDTEVTHQAAAALRAPAAVAAVMPSPHAPPASTNFLPPST